MVKKPTKEELKSRLDELAAEISILQDEREEVLEAYTGAFIKEFPVGTEVLIPGVVVSVDPDDASATFNVEYDNHPDSMSASTWVRPGILIKKDKFLDPQKS